MASAWWTGRTSLVTLPWSVDVRLLGASMAELSIIGRYWTISFTVVPQFLPRSLLTEYWAPRSSSQLQRAYWAGSVKMNLLYSCIPSTIHAELPIITV